MDMDISDSTIRDWWDIGDLLHTITDEEWNTPDPDLRSCRDTREEQDVQCGKKNNDIQESLKKTLEIS